MATNQDSHTVQQGKTSTRFVSRWHPYPAYKPSAIAWLGNVPAHWEARRLKYIARFIYGDSLAADDRQDGSVPVFGSNGIVGTHSTANTLAPAIVIGRKGSFGKVNYSAQRCFAIDTTFYVDHRSSKEDFRWLFYSLQLLGLDTSSQDSAVPGLSREAAYENWLPAPPPPEQRAIAAFLDRETAKLDALVDKKERLIELLQEKRTALISHAVTKGLDPRLPMKDSGISWLGEIPTHWQVHQLRRVVSKFVDYRGATPDKVSDGILLITARNIKNGTIDFDLSHEYIRREDYAGWMVRGLPEVGDVLLTTEAPLGETAQIVDTNVALAQRIILFKVEKDLLINDYLRQHFASASGQSELWSRATGSTAIGIKAYHLKETLVTVPPTAEQRAIATYLDRETARIDALVAKVRQAIETLREYRTALISAAVTGQIDVREEGDLRGCRPGGSQ